ncbi:hypothetical protein [Metabacillus fastidiosus]
MKMIKCVAEEDYEKFTYFFLRNRNEFDDVYPILDTVGSIYTMISETNILLFYDNDKVIAAMSYSYGTRECNFEDKHIVFIDCSLIENKYRKSYLFIRGFQEVVRHMAEENKDCKEVRFYAYRHHKYIHRLYKKFATVIEEKEGYFGLQDVFSVEFDRLVTYLGRFK